MMTSEEKQDCLDLTMHCTSVVVKTWKLQSIGYPAVSFSGVYVSKCPLKGMLFVTHINWGIVQCRKRNPQNGETNMSSATVVEL